MNDNLICQSLIVSGIPFKNKAKESSCWQEAKVLWQTDGSVWMQRLSDWSGRTELDPSDFEQTKGFWYAGSGSH